MNFNFYRKVIILVVSISLSAVLLSACSTKNSTNSNFTSETADKGSSSTKFDTNAKTVSNPFGKYDPTIDISFVRAVDDDITKNVLPKTPGETIEDNRWLKLYKEQLGINIEYKWTVKGDYLNDAYNQKINIDMVSGDLPDVVTVNSSQLKKLADSGMIEDMTRYYNDYAAPLTKDIYSREGTAILDSATLGGKLMAVPRPEDSVESAPYLWIRADWLKKLGLEPPKTMEDLLKISEAFTTRDPDGNGRADTYGLAITKNLYYGCMGLEGFFAGFHSYPNFWQGDSSGKLVYGSVQPETKTALEKLAEMYRAGQLDKEFSLKDGGKVAETIAAGKIGMEFGQQWNPLYPLISSFNNNNNADWTGYSLVSADSKPLKVPLKFMTSMYYAVKKGYKHPEALVKLMNLFMEKDYGKASTGDFFKYFMPAENGNVGVWKFSPVTANAPLTNLNVFLAIEKARNSKDISSLKDRGVSGVAANIEAYNKGDKTQWGWVKIYGVNGVFNVLKQYKANNSLMFEKFVGPPTKTMLERKDALDKYEKDEFVKIIMGAAPIDEFDKFVSDWNKLGGDAITKEVNDWYASVKK